MFDDFRQDKEEEHNDPIPEGSHLPWNKKIVLLCIAVAAVGLFIFFTSDGWVSSEKSSTEQETFYKELDELKSRISSLEQSLQSTPQPTESNQTPNLSNLKSLIEQELSDIPSQNEKPTPKPVATKQYTVKSGDSLSKISQQFYGSPRKWKKIVDANKDKLGNNQVLRPGMVLTIPEE